MQQQVRHGQADQREHAPHRDGAAGQPQGHGLPAGHGVRAGYIVTGAAAPGAGLKVHGHPTSLPDPRFETARASTGCPGSGRANTGSAAPARAQAGPAPGTRPAGAIGMARRRTPHAW